MMIDGLVAAVTVEWPPPDWLAPTDALQLSVWITEHIGHDVTGVHRITVDQTTMMVWRRVPNARIRIDGPTSTRLRSAPPAGLLARLAAAGTLSCAATVVDTDESPRWRCNVLVDEHGRHLGGHLDGLAGDDARWPNGNPVDAPTPPPGDPIPSRTAIRVVLALALNLCPHTTTTVDCRHCPGIDLAATAVHAMMIGTPQ